MLQYDTRPDDILCEYIDWDSVDRLATRLSRQIRQANFQPDIVVAIARGGYVPARLVCDHLDLYELTSIRIEHYLQGMAKTQSPRLSMPIGVDVRDRRILLIDDVTDSGDTLGLALEHIRSNQCAEFKVGVLHHKVQSNLIPDFYAQEVKQWRWLIYPWAVMEDSHGFIKRMPDKPKNPIDAKYKLKQLYDLDVPEWVIEEVYRIYPELSQP